MSDEFVKKDAGKLPMRLLPAVAIEQVVQVLAFGAKKYKDDGWRGVDKRSRYYDALMRHMLAWQMGQDTDEESGLPHLAHALCSLMFLAESQALGYGVDDRVYKVKNPLGLTAVIDAPARVLNPDTGWKNISHITCKQCSGSGRSAGSGFGSCWRCKGHGTLSIDDVKKDDL